MTDINILADKATALVAFFIWIILMIDDRLSLHSLLIDSVVALIMAGFFNIIFFAPIKFIVGIQQTFKE